MNLIKEHKCCPYCNSDLYVNIREYANHLRWCKDNPKYDEILKNTTDKLKKSLNEHYKELKSQTYQDYNLICECCGSEYTLNLSKKNFENGKYRKTCSKECWLKLTSLHTDKESKNLKISQSTSSKGTENFCKCCGKPIILSRVFCSTKCEKTYRFNNSKSYKEPLERYRRQCSFKFKLSDFPEEFDFELIKKNGWYKAKNRGDNLRGVSRDHMFSVKEGFKQNIDPYLISHPANCQLLIHTDNESKCSKCSITIDELKERIVNWTNKYGEYPNKIIY